MKKPARTSSSSAVVHIVDDDEPIRRALSRLVRSVGMEARTFGSPKELLDQADLSEARCLLLDVQLPGMSGLDLYERMVAAGRSVPVIFITAHPNETGRARARMLEAVAYLEKPVDDKHLLAALNAALKPHERPARSVRSSRARRESEPS